jgi:hypothetical protein
MSHAEIFSLGEARRQGALANGVDGIAGVDDVVGCSVSRALVVSRSSRARSVG